MGCQPTLKPLGGRHAAVHGHQGLLAVAGGKPGPKTRLQLGREVDLGHHDQRLRIWRLREQTLDALQVDLGFATAGGAKQQAGPGFGIKLGYSPCLLWG